MTTMIEATSSALSLRERAIAASQESYRDWQAEKAEKARADRERDIDVLRIALRDHLGVQGDVSIAEHVTDHREYQIVEMRASVDGLEFSLRKDEFGNANWPRLHVLLPCSRDCGKDLWVLADDLEHLGSALESKHEHRDACLQQFDDEGEPTTDRDGKPLPPRGPFSDTPQSSSPWQRANDRIKSIDDAAREMAIAQERVTRFEDERAPKKAAAIKRLMSLTNELTGKLHSASSAEAVVELDAEYAEYRNMQREAEIDRHRTIAAYEIALLTARLAVESFVVEERNR